MKCQPTHDYIGNITSHIVRHDPRSLGNKEPLAIVAVGEALDDLGYLRLGGQPRQESVQCGQKEVW